MKDENIQLKPCPFCGFQVDRYGLIDVLYPTGVYWRQHDEMDREYVGFKERRMDDKPCYQLLCNVTMGGCGAEMHGDTIEDVVDKWNTRI